MTKKQRENIRTTKPLSAPAIEKPLGADSEPAILIENRSEMAKNQGLSAKGPRGFRWGAKYFELLNEIQGFRLKTCLNSSLFNSN